TEKAVRRRNVRLWVSHLALVGAVCLVMFSPQLAYWHHQTGHFVADTYPGEHFYWGSPELLNFLFSVRKGLFFWSPMLLAAAVGIPLLTRQDDVLGGSVAAILVLHIYLCASWYAWWSGGSFGSRRVVNVLPFYALALSYTIAAIKRRFGIASV